MCRWRRSMRHDLKVVALGLHAPLCIYVFGFGFISCPFIILCMIKTMENPISLLNQKKYALDKWRYMRVKDQLGLVLQVTVGLKPRGLLVPFGFWHQRNSLTTLPYQISCKMNQLPFGDKQKFWGYHLYWQVGKTCVLVFVFCLLHMVHFGRFKQAWVMLVRPGLGWQHDTGSMTQMTLIGKQPEILATGEVTKSLHISWTAGAVV